jgi:hypothetical protein
MHGRTRSSARRSQRSDHSSHPTVTFTSNNHDVVPQQNSMVDHSNRGTRATSLSSSSMFSPPPCCTTPNSITSSWNGGGGGRKRMITESQHDETNNSQAAGSTASSALSSNVDIDSMRPVAAPRSRKRRKTGILDAFNSISLVGPQKKGSSWHHKNHHHHDMTESSTLSGTSSGFGRSISIPADQAIDDGDSSQAVAEVENMENNGDYYSSTGSSLGDDSINEDDLNHHEMNLTNGLSCSDDEDSDVKSEGHFLSDVELLVKKQERKVMLELVFGPSSEFVPAKDPVDVKIKQLIRKSLDESGLPASAAIATQSKDDMNLEYYVPSPRTVEATTTTTTRSSSSSSFPRRYSSPRTTTMPSPLPPYSSTMQDVEID